MLPRKKKVMVTLRCNNTVATLNRMFWMDVEFTELLFNHSVQCLRSRFSADLKLRFAQVIKPLSSKDVSIRFDGQECIDTLSMIVICRQKIIIIVNFRNWTRVGVWENENAKVQTLFHARCLHSSSTRGVCTALSSSQTFMNVHYSVKTRKGSLYFLSGNKFWKYFPFHSVFIMVFIKEYLW